MQQLLHFANSYWLMALGLVVLLGAFIRLKWYRYAVYRYSLGLELQKNKLVSHHLHRSFFFVMRFLLLAGLVFFIGRPQLVDPHSSLFVEGIDIVIALDLSGSMQVSDYSDNNESRVDIAKKEAVRFIEKRKNDPIGLVVFGSDSVSRCPITADKKILTSLVNDLSIGVVNSEGTVLSQALLTAANRLKKSTAKSKIIILLTDGEPSGNDVKPDVAIEVAKKMGIKMYTIGIGSDKEEYVSHPLFGVVQKPKVNKELLKRIAQETGGMFFLASSQKDMRRVYEEIDALEKTEYETTLFSNYRELFTPYIWFLLFIVVIEIIFSTLIWFGI